MAEATEEDIDTLLGQFSDSSKLTNESYAKLAFVLQKDEEQGGLNRSISKVLYVWLSGTEMGDYEKAMRAISVLFELKPTLATVLCGADSISGLLVEVAEEIISSSLKSVKQSLATLINTAATHPAARPLVKKLNAEAWLESITQETGEDQLLRVICIVALIKLNFVQKAATAGEAASKARQNFPLYSKLLLPHCDASQPIQSVALEGLAVLTLLPEVRLEISLPELKRLCSIKSIGKTADTLQIQQQLFSHASILHNLTLFKPILNQEDQAAQKLRQFSLKAEGVQEGQWEADQIVDKRIKEMISGGVMECVASFVRAVGESSRQLAGNILLNLTRQVPLRGTLIQQGAAKMLLSLLARFKGNSKEAMLPAIHALARLLITSNPLLVVGPSPTSPDLQEATTYLCSLLIQPTATSLAQFECLLALTNITSIAEALRTRVLSVSSIPAKLESYLLINDEKQYASIMTRRASVQLFNNLVMSEAGFCYFAQDTTGMDDSLLPSELMPYDQFQTRLHLLLALCDVEDHYTRIAASGALSVLVISPRVCTFLLSEKMVKRSTVILGQLLVEDDEGLQQRGFACVGQVVEKLDDLGKEVIKRVQESELGAILSEASQGADKELRQAAKGILSKLESL